jgi:hypothetical protein
MCLVSRVSLSGVVPLLPQVPLRRAHRQLYLYHNSITTWRVVLEKPTVAGMVKNILALYGTQIFVVVTTTTFYSTLFWVKWIQSTSLHSVFLTRSLYSYRFVKDFFFFFFCLWSVWSCSNWVDVPKFMRMDWAKPQQNCRCDWCLSFEQGSFLITF